MAKNENGVWLDKESGKVVTFQPERGRLLVSPGKEITDNVQAQIDRYEDNYANFEQATAPDNVEKRAGEVDLGDMTKDELLDEADRRGVDVNKSATKGEILDALNG
jgi:hypothetical protein